MRSNEKRSAATLWSAAVRQSSASLVSPLSHAHFFRHLFSTRVKRLWNSPPNAIVQSNGPHEVHLVRVTLTAMLPLLFQYIHARSFAKKCSRPGKGGEKSTNLEPITIGSFADLPIVPMSWSQFASGTRRSSSHGRIKGLEGYPSAPHGMCQSIHFSFSGTTKL